MIFLCVEIKLPQPKPPIPELKSLKREYLLNLESIAYMEAMRVVLMNGQILELTTKSFFEVKKALESHLFTENEVID